MVAQTKNYLVMNNTIILVIKDRDHNHSIVNFIVCDTEYTASRVQNKLDRDPKYSLPCYYTEIIFANQIIEEDLVDKDGFLKEEYKMEEINDQELSSFELMSEIAE